MRESIKHPAVVYRVVHEPYNPKDINYDQVITFLICEKLGFNWQNIVTDINELYTGGLSYRYRHNFILSIEE